MTDVTDEQKDQLLATLKSGQKIVAIKQCREMTGLGLKEAKEFVESLAASNGIEVPAASGCGSMIFFALTATAVYWTVR